MLLTMQKSEMAERLRIARTRAGYETATAAAISLGIAATTYAAHENGNRNFGAATADKYARKFRVSFLWLVQGKGAIDAGPEDAGDSFSGEAVPARVAVPALGHMPLDVPLMGTALAAAIGGFRITPQRVDTAPRPRGLMHAHDVYAIFIAGDSMDPAHPAGELRYVAPHRPPRLGDTVIVRTRTHETAEEVAFIGILAGQDEEHVTLRKLNPPATVRHERRFVTGVHKVLTVNEMMGI